MKTYILSLLLLLGSFFSFAQNQNSQSNLNGYILSQQINNQELFANQLQTSRIISLAGVTTSLIGVLSNSPELTYVGSGLTFISLVVDLDSYKWLRKDKIRFTNPTKTKNHFNRYFFDSSKLNLVFNEISFKKGDYVVIVFRNTKKDPLSGIITDLNENELSIKTIDNSFFIKYEKIFNIINNLK